jgi:signal transduction histidine kinase
MVSLGRVLHSLPPMQKTLAEPLQRALLAQVIDQMPAGVIIAAPNGQILLANVQAERIWRRPILRSNSVAEYVSLKGFHADGRPYRAEEWPLARSVQNGEIVDSEEVEFVRGDGTRAVMRVSSAPIRDGNGNIAAAVVTFFDVTRQRREQDALRFLARASAAIGATMLTDETLRAVAHLSIPSFADVAVLFLIGGGEIQRIEVAAADEQQRRMIEDTWTKERHLASSAVHNVIETGKPLLLRDVDADYEKVVGTALHPHLAETVGARSMITVAMHSGKMPFGALMFLRTRDENRYDEFDLFVAEEIARRGVTAMERSLLFESERAQRLRAEHAASRLQHLQTLSSAVSAAVSVEDVARAVIAVARDIAGASIVVVGRVEGEELHIIAASGIADAFLEQYHNIPLSTALPLAESIRTCEPIWLGTFDEAVARSPLFRDAQPGSTSRAWAVLPLTADGQSIGAIGLSFASEQAFSDADRSFLMSLASQCGLAFERARLYDAERRAREEAEQASRAKDDFLAILSHEMRTPMTTVIGWADFLKMTHGNDPAISGPVDSLRTSARAQARLVDDLLDVSRIVAGKLRIEPRDTDLSEIIRSATDQLLVTADTKGIYIESYGVDEPLPIRGDPDRLRQVLTNLLTNAVKFTPAAGHVSIRAARRELLYEVLVEDDGEGISADFLPHVFDRFRQASIGDSRRHSGLGLGLSIVQHLVQLHGGRVWAESDGVGKGARFTVELPAPGRSS